MRNRIIVALAIVLTLVAAYFIVAANETDQPQGEIPSGVLH